MIIDAHQHFWQYDPQRHSWIDDSMAEIRKSFLPKDLQHILAANEIDGCVLVQVDQTEAETEYFLELAKANGFIKAVVGWIDLMADDVAERLAHFKQFQLLKGFRHILQGQPNGFMLQPSFQNGIKQLGNHGFTFDILIYPNQLTEALQLVQKNSHQLFVLDHLAKPYVKSGLIADWKSDIEALAQHENVYCKISGMVTEADYNNWKQEDFAPYLDAVTNAFGTKRLMFGSDWPVCLVAAPYANVVSIVKDYFHSFSKEEQVDIFGLNAVNFYQIK